MSRRGSPAVQVFIVVGVVCLFLYGFYCYHQLHTRLKRSDETVDKLRQKAESLSAQLQVLYEHKTRLEKAVEEEKGLVKKTKEDLDLQLKETENKFNNEKTQCDIVKSEVETLKMKSQETEALRVKLEQGYKQLEQERANDIARLNDDIANIQRRYNECEKQRGEFVPTQPAAGSNNLPNMQREGQQQLQQQVAAPQRGEQQLLQQHQMPQQNEHQSFGQPGEMQPREGRQSEDQHRVALQREDQQRQEEPAVNPAKGMEQHLPEGNAAAADDDDDGDTKVADDDEDYKDDIEKSHRDGQFGKDNGAGRNKDDEDKGAAMDKDGEGEDNGALRNKDAAVL